MAKASKSIAFKNAVIDKAEGTITEFTKDDTKVYSIEKLLEDWDQKNFWKIGIRLKVSRLQLNRTMMFLQMSKG